MENVKMIRVWDKARNASFMASILMFLPLDQGVCFYMRNVLDIRRNKTHEADAKKMKL